MSLAEKISQQQAERERQQAENQARRDEQKRQQVQQAQNDLADYQKQQADLEKQLADLSSEQAKLELEQQKRDLQSQARQKIISDYDSEILKLQNQMVSDRSVFRTLDPSGTSRQTEQQKLDQMRNDKRYLSQIKKIETQKTVSLGFFDYQSTYPDRPLSTPLSRQFKENPRDNSLVDLARMQDASLRAAEVNARMNAEVNARSDLAKDEQRLEEIKRELAIKKEEKDSMFGAEKAKFQNFNLTISTKPGRKPADPFALLPDVNPESIFGTTEAKSKQAVYTFEETERQQADLARQMREAGNAKEAYEIKTEFQTKNPYVGTANIAKYKGKTIDTQGVTIEKELNAAIPDFQNMLNAEPQSQQSRDITISLTESLDIGESLGGGSQAKPQRAEIIFLDKKGQEIKNPGIETLWQYTKESLNLAGLEVTSSKSDLAINKYESENLDTIAAFQRTDAAKTAGSVTPLIDRSKLSFESGVIGQVDELADLVLGKETKNPSIESLATSDLTDSIRAGIGIGPAKESETLKALTEKAKSPEGKLWIAGSLVGSGVAAAATFIVPSLLSVKIAKLAARQTLKEASEIAIKLSSEAPDRSFIVGRAKEIARDLKIKYPSIPDTELKKFTEKIIAEQNPKVSEIQRREELSNLLKKTAPKMTEKERAGIMAKTFGDQPYTIDLINSRTALITTGTESTQSRIILYERGGAFKLYETSKEREAILKDILLKGKQTDTKEIAASLRERYPQMAAETLQNAIKSLSKDLEKGKVIITEKQARLAQKESPLIRETKEQITIGDKKFRVLAGTAAVHYEKMDLGRYRATKKNLAKLADDSEYAFLGTEKTGRSKDLKNFPKTVVESIEKEVPYRATGIYERTRKEKPGKGGSTSSKEQPGKKARSYTTGKFGIGNEKIEIKTDSKSKIEITTSKSELAKLENIAREQVTNPKSLVAEISAMTNTMKISATGSRADTATAQRQQSRAATESKQIGAQMSKTGLKVGQALDTIRIQKLNTKTGLEELDLVKTAEKISIRITDDQSQAGLYSLITARALKERQAEQLRFKIKIDQKLITDLEIPTKEKPPRTTTDIPPGRPTIILFANRKNKAGGKKVKAGKIFYRWNVNELSPGYYLPTKELTVGKTRKAISKVEKIQRKQIRLQKTETENNLSKAFIETTKVKQRRSKPSQPNLTKNLREFNKYVNTPKSKKFRFK